MSQSSSTDNFDATSPTENVNLRHVAQYALIVFFLELFLALPETGIMTAIKTNESVAHSLSFAPSIGEGFALGNTQFTLEQLSGSFFNSLIMSTPATIGSVLFGSMAAYGLAMVNWRAQMGVLMLFVAGVFVPYQAVLVPLACFWNDIFPLMRMIKPMVASIPFFQGCHTKFVPLVITHITYETPICTILFRSYHQSLPGSFVEAGKIDGTNITKIYRRIILLISRPIFGVVFICQFAQIYNGFLFAFTLITGSDASAAPVTLALPAIGASTSGIDFGIEMSAAFFVAIPALTLYVTFTERSTKELRMEA